MATTDLTYKVNFDLSELDTKSQEAKSRISSMLGTGSADFGGAMTGLAQFGGAATSAFGMMRGGLERGAAAIGTFTDPGIAHSMHYGMLQAQSSFGQEMGAYVHGPAGVLGQTPPGVGAADYTAMLTKNLGTRTADMAAGFLGGAAPVAAGFAAWSVGSKLGKWGGLGGIGQFGAGLVASMAAEHVVGGAIERGNQMFAEVGQLGQLATAGRGMSLAQTHEFGRGFKSMAQNMGISSNELGDMVAGIRGAGMMPETKNVKESLSQFEGMAKDIRDIAVSMKTSLATATGYLRDVERMGMGRGAGGVFAAASMAEGLGTSLGGLISHVGQGQSVGMQTGIGGGVGGQLFLQSAFAGAQGAKALTGEERLMTGGAMGLGRTFGMHAIQNAMGPWGEMQGMAMMGPRGAMGLPGTAIGTIEQAAGNMFGGGDPIANMVEFSTNRSRMQHQMGATGLRQMQAQAIQTQAQMLQSLSPGLTEQRALQFTAQNMGLNEHQARAMAGYIQRGFKDMRPRAEAVGMPGVFGSSGTAIRMSQASQDSAVRAEMAVAAEEGKMPWTKAADYFADKWSHLREGFAERADTAARVRLQQQGYVEASPSAHKMAANIFRTGKIPGGFIPVDISTKPGSALNTALSFGGQAGGWANPGELRSVARNISRSMNPSKSMEDDIDNAMVQISSKYGEGKGQFDAAKMQKQAAYNSQKALAGGASSGEFVRRFRGDVSQVMWHAGSKYGKEFKEKGFAGEHGAAMVGIASRALGMDVGGFIQRASGSAQSAVAWSIDKQTEDLMLEATGGKWESSGRREATQTYLEGERDRASKSIKSNWATASGVAGILSGAWIPTIATSMYSSAQEKKYDVLASVNQQQMDKERIERSEANRERAVQNFKVVATAPESFKNLISATKKGDVHGQLTALMDMNTKIAKSKGTNAEKFKIASSIAVKAMTDQKFTKAMDGVVDVMVGRSGEKERSRKVQPKQVGRQVSFQSQADSFQGQVANALRKTSHTLKQVRDTMIAMEGRLGKK